MNLIDYLQKIKIVPIATFNDVSSALKICEILEQNSINIIEITLRTEEAISCIEEISRNFPEMFIGAGSVLSKDALKAAIDAGVKFAVSPCIDLDVIEYALSIEIHFIPGISTPSELNIALKLGMEIIKIFPSVSLGGVKYIRDIVLPYKIMNFHLLPTGGINLDNLNEFINTERVIACGLSYITNSKLIEKKEFGEISNRIKCLMKLIDR